MDTENHHIQIMNQFLFIHEKGEESEDEYAQHEALIDLAPLEAIKIAEYILSCRTTLEKLDKDLKDQFESDAALVLKHFPKHWEEQKRKFLVCYYSDISIALLRTQESLVDRKQMPYRDAIYKQYFWKHFHQWHGEQLSKECLGEKHV